MKKVAISQSNYIPWKGYFDMIASVDTFVLYDDMQYTKRDWRNRNRIKTPRGLKWLSIPVEVKGKYLQKINETVVSNTSWSISHWSSIEQSYKGAPHFSSTAKWLKPLFDEVERLSHLSDINRVFLLGICKQLGIKTEIRSSDEFELIEGKTSKLVDLCEKLNADLYLSGPSAQSYLEQVQFHEKGMSVEWFDNAGYPEYSQIHGEFEHYVSILDLFFNAGSDASLFLKVVE